MSKLARVLALGALMAAMSLGSAAHAQSSDTPSQPASGTPSQPAGVTQPGPPPAPGPSTPTPPPAPGPSTPTPPPAPGPSTPTPPPVLQQLTVSASPAQGRPGTTVALEADLGRCPQPITAKGVFVDHAGRSRPLADQLIRASRFLAHYTVTAGDAVGQGRFQIDCLHDATVVGGGTVNFQVLRVDRQPPRVTVAVSPPAGRPGTVVTITAQVPGGCASAVAFFQDRKAGVSNSARRAAIVTSGDRQLVARYTITNNDAVGRGRFGVACELRRNTYRIGYASFQVRSHEAPIPPNGPDKPPTGGDQVNYGGDGTIQLPDQIDTGLGGTADRGLDPMWLLPLAGLLLIAVALGLRLRQTSRRP